MYPPPHKKILDLKKALSYVEIKDIFSFTCMCNCVALTASLPNM